MELTFAQRWKENHIPLRDYKFSVAERVGDGSNGAVNDIPLPNLWSARDEPFMMVCLYESNRDWVPFFSSPKVADNVLGTLADYKSYSDSDGDFGLIFRPRHNDIWASYTASEEEIDTEEEEGYPLDECYGTIAFKVGTFNDTTRKLVINIKKAIKSGTPIKDEAATNLQKGIWFPAKDLGTNDAYLDWTYQGTEHQTSLKSYKLAKSVFEKMYQRKTPLSEVPACHMAE